MRAHNEPPHGLQARLALQRCLECGRSPNYPRIRCPYCFGEFEWIGSDGRGTVVDFTIVHRPHSSKYDKFVPIVMAHIALDEEVGLIATILGDDRLATKIGSRVVAT